jgi:hypothetical protein
MKTSMAARLRQLESAKDWRGPDGGAKAERLLRSLETAEIRNPQALIRMHDHLLFLRAFPQGPGVIRETERLLAAVHTAVARLRDSRVALGQFDLEAVSGISGTVLRDKFTYEVARWLLLRYPKQVRAAWDIDEQSRRLGAALPRFVPLLDDDCMVEADTPYLSWLRQVAGEGREWQWLMKRLEDAGMPIAHKTELYDALEIQIEWELGDCCATRTRARRVPAQIFCHETPLIRRNQVSLAEEFQSPPPAMRLLGQEEGEEILDMCRDAVTVRYRELWGTTRGDPAQVYEADAGRGVQIFLWGLPPDRRLPLRAYHAGFTLKNGVPVNYIEAISLFEWMEVGFNTFYAYRDGETAWIYSKALHFLHQLTRVNCISVYPYQLGHENEEAIQSGAFWFYRKLGFRPGRRDLLGLTQSEERKMALNSKHRSSPRTLRRLAAAHAFYEIGSQTPGRWDTFSTRNLGFAVQQKIAAHYAGNPDAMRKDACMALSRILDVDPASWNVLAQTAFEHFAVVLSLVPALERWTSSERQALIEVIRAKASGRETEYLHLLQGHDRLRDAMVRLGSAPVGPIPMRRRNPSFTSASRSLNQESI